MMSARNAEGDGGVIDLTEDSVAFPILDLPPELVVRIIEHAVTISSKDKRVAIFDGTNAHQEPAITRVCRWFRSEGLPLFYTQNMFTLSTTRKSTQALFRWVNNIGLQRASTIQNLHLYWFDNSPLCDLTLGKFLSEMRFLEDCAEAAGLGPRFGEHIFVRFQDSKLVLGSGNLDRCYELSFVKFSRTSGEWQRVAELSALFNPNTPGQFAGKDFWVTDSDSDNTASDLVKHEGEDEDRQDI
ncbi:hypothetical protein CB0940_06355 [Cercospora beticola]|uniref:F-box domain-containing protein n=1 Tax=Cercospora beticola TaxID=122368 RepID=A0A2G5I069_CERBT|nr:hypothetical protein CB0940_06355 [Cercospora beticola]PIA98151.1 hypothetical protein CB0940_06355 [Cercospora beticola]WPA98983.1 hypothetical protein RHO25_003596 [Cercospora beticola]CAK1360284.1 unnamed protein product [Cercospora beticola]